MKVRELLEAKPWQGFKGTISSRVWFDTRSGQAMIAAEDGNHSVSVVNNKELFGLTDQDWAAAGIRPDEKIGDYDGRVLFAAMKKGWVRLYVDSKAPDRNSNAEGLNFSGLRRATLWYCEQVGTPQQFTLVVRTGPGDREGTPHRLSDMEAIDYFIRKGTLPREPGQQPVQVRQMNVTPHAFRKV
jgi:hypothetical protein